MVFMWHRGLEELYMSHCHLADLKRTVARYPALQILDVSFNQIQDVEQLVILRFVLSCNILLYFRCV